MEDRIEGTITEIRDHGTIVQVVVETDHAARPWVVNFDHRPFAHFAADVGPENLVGLRVRVEETDEGPVVEVLS